MEFEGIVSRRHVSGGRTDVVFISGGERRIGRVFRFDGDASVIRKLTERLSALDIPGLITPDDVREVGSRLYCLSASGIAVAPFRGTPMTFEEMLRPLRMLHQEGWLHLDLSQHSFVERSGRPHLVFWGDALVSAGGLPEMPGEVAAGAFPGPAADYYLLGQLMPSTRGYLWQDDDAPEPSLLTNLRPSRRMNAMAERLGEVRQESLPREARWLPKPGLTVVSGGSMPQRDALINEWASTAWARGWSVRVVRCRPQERTRPLPDRPFGGERVDSPSGLMRCLFPVASGIDRLLVIDQIDYASADLMAILGGFTGASPPDLAVVVTEVRSPVLAERSAVDEEVRLAGEPGAAVDRGIDELVDGPLPGFPGPGWYGVRFRGPESYGPEPVQLAMSLRQLYDEGADRAVCEISQGMEKLTDEQRSVVASSCVNLGRFRDAESLAPESASMIRGRALMGMGRAAEAEGVLRRALSEPGAREDKAMLLARCLMEEGRLGEAEDLLETIESPRAVPLIARVLDQQGRPSESLQLISEALGTTEGTQRVGLLSSLANVNMRLGNYGSALEAADEAVEISRRVADTGSLRTSLQQRGRVREVLGRWPEALEDYKLAAFYSRESMERSARPPHVDLFVLQLRMGEIQAAFRTWEELELLLTGEGSTSALQLLSMLRAYTGVLLGRGATALPEARKAANMAAEQGLTLMQALSLLYTGQLLAQESETARAEEVLRRASSIASALGDRHLELLIDLAMFRIAGQGRDARELRWRAEELGLLSECLETRAAASSGERERESALQDMLDLPSPLQACEIASSFGLPSDGRLRARLLRAFQNISDALPDEDLEGYRKINAPLSGLSEGRLARAPEPGHIERQITVLSDWIREHAGGESDLGDLARRLGLQYLGTSPSGSEEDQVVAESETGSLYARGLDMSAARLIGPLVLSVAMVSPVSTLQGEQRDDRFPEIVGASSATRTLKRTMQRVAGQQVPVLILGATGTGKELVARGVHRASACGGSFVAVDCGAIPEHLLESELFGAARGAYTDSRHDRSGLLEAAAGGTLFLDEISNMSSTLQAKLLRVLETGGFRRLGDTAERRVRFRLLAATNEDLMKRVAEGSFRSDLYYRMAVMVVRVPDLAERIEDIPLLVRHFAASMPSSHEEDGPSDSREIPISKGALQKLASHSWPGNVRELRNVVQRAVVMAGDRPISASDIVFEKTGAAPAHRVETLQAGMARHVRRVVDACDGNRSRAARILECDPKTVRKYLRLYEDLPEDDETKGEPAR